jgi:hypothetical protein
MVTLEKPYQRGWMRQFILRDDIRRSDKFEFYQTLLDKINTTWYHPDRSFKRRKIRKRRYVYEEKQQTLQEFDQHEFHSNKLNLSDAEKRCFYLKETWNNRYNRWETTYACTETWRFVLTIKPHIIYKKKPVDELLEQELSEINKYIDWNNLQPRISKLHGNAYKYWGDVYFDKLKYINKLKNKPRYTSKEAYLDY